MSRSRLALLALAIASVAVTACSDATTAPQAKRTSSIRTTTYDSSSTGSCGTYAGGLGVTCTH